MKTRPCKGKSFPGVARSPNLISLVMTVRSASLFAIHGISNDWREGKRPERQYRLALHPSSADSAVALTGRPSLDSFCPHAQERERRTDAIRRPDSLFPGIAIVLAYPFTIPLGPNCVRFPLHTNFAISGQTAIGSGDSLLTGILRPFGRKLPSTNRSKRCIYYHSLEKGVSSA
jgi:hypothetical protein